MRIRYLSQKEKQRTRSLYEIAFPGDSQAFTDYYYQWKIKENSVIVMEEDGRFLDSFFHVMIHLNPYILWINGKKKKIPYLVAVATHPDSRRQGRMSRVMCSALQDIARGHMPFTFLMPADPAYYTGQGFVFFPCLECRSRTADDMLNAAEISSWASPAEQCWQKAREEDIPELAVFSNEILKERYQIFVNRSTHYYQRLMAETAAEHGGVLLCRNDGKLCGILAYALEELGEVGNCRAEIRELLLQEPVSREEAQDIFRKAVTKTSVTEKSVAEITFTPAEMMVRITNLMELVPLLKSQQHRCIYVKVRDSLIRSNNGCFCISLDRDGGSIAPIPQQMAERTVDISDLAKELLADTAVYLNEWV